MGKEFTSDEIELVIARLQAIPDTIRLSIGTGKGMTFSKEQLIEHVRNAKNGDVVGQTIIEMQLDYVRSYK